jgi:predicted phage terminase large subunit-like protein
VVGSATRWHEKDLHGHLISEMKVGGETWDVVNLPAISEENDQMGRLPGQPLWRERYPLKALLKIKRAVGQYVWSSQFQQRPAPREGGIFKREWFSKITDRAPAELDKIVRHWDLAATEETAGDDPDFTCGLKAGTTADGRIFILDMVRGRWSPDSVEKIIQQTARIDGLRTAVRMEQEPAASGKSLISYYARKILAAFDFRGAIPSGDKVVRATPAAAACERGDVWLVNGPWIADFIESLTTFPKAAHDDPVDAFSGAYQHLFADQRDWDASDWQSVMQPTAQRRSGPKTIADKLRAAAGQ